MAGCRRGGGGDVQQVGEVGAPPAAVVAGGEVGPGPVGGFAEHAGQDQDLDRWHLLGELAAAVVEFVAVLPALAVSLVLAGQAVTAGWALWSAGVAARAGAVKKRQPVKNKKPGFRRAFCIATN